MDVLEILAAEIRPATLLKTGNTAMTGHCGYVPASSWAQRRRWIKAGRIPCKKPTAYHVTSTEAEGVFEVCTDHAGLVRTFPWLAEIRTA